MLARFIHNDRLVDALHQQAFCALNASPGARAYYDELRSRGMNHHAALRQLFNRCSASCTAASKPATPTTNTPPGQHTTTTINKLFDNQNPWVPHRRPGRDAEAMMSDQVLPRERRWSMPGPRRSPYFRCFDGTNSGVALRWSFLCTFRLRRVVSAAFGPRPLRKAKAQHHGRGVREAHYCANVVSTHRVVPERIAIVQTVFVREACHLASVVMIWSTTESSPGPMMSGCAPIGLSTMPGRATNAALHPALSAPDTSQEWAATRRTSDGSTSNVSATDRYGSLAGLGRRTVSAEITRPKC